MDEAGYIPIAFVCNFPNIICYGADYQLIIKYLMESSYIEVDIVNETMRLKEGWEQVSLNYLIELLQFNLNEGKYIFIIQVAHA